MLNRLTFLEESIY